MNRLLHQLRTLLNLITDAIVRVKNRSARTHLSGSPAREWIRHRPHRSRSLLIFVHGFNGHYRDTWQEFPQLLASTPDLPDTDVLLWGYPTRLFQFRNQPGIRTMGKLFLTELRLLARDYDTIVIAGHSMGGLVIRAAMIGAIKRRRLQVLAAVRHIVLYGTPNEGIMIAACIPAFLSHQIADMDATSQFIRTLNREWILTGLICPASQYDVAVTAVAGINDDFVPEDSALAFFTERETVRGDHLTMVKPDTRQHNSFRILTDCIRRTLSTAKPPSP